jgi:multidrug efflux system outer membrane protein
LSRRGVQIGGASLLALLAGCKVGPEYQKPAVETPPAFRGQEPAPAAEPGEAAESIADQPWWEVYRDPALASHIGDAIRSNHDLRIALARIEQARAIAAASRSALFPTIGYGAAISSGRNESLGGAAYNAGDNNTPFFGALTAAWELDVWGRIRRLNEAALADYLATQEARRVVLLTLVSDVAQVYFELLELDLELAIARRTTDSFGESLRIFSLRQQGGTASKLETSRAEAAMTSVAASIPEIERLIALKENQLSVLCGRAPGPIERADVLLDGLLPAEVPAGVPAALLERRPDLRQAEQELRAANARIGVAIADWYPRIGLTAFFGKVAPEVGMLTAGSTNAWSVAASATGPIFTAGALDAQLEGARAVWQEVALRYDRAVLTALREVSDALVSRDKLRGVREEQSLAVRAYEEAVKVSMQRYVAGKSSYYEVLEAQQQLFPQEIALARTRLGQLAVDVSLYKALGGGWALPAEQWGPPTEPPPAPPDLAQSAGKDKGKVD